LRFVINELREKGFSEFALEVKKNNDIAFSLYTKFGFIIDNENNNNSWIMKLSLKIYYEMGKIR
jgi:ribosomal protein S18 acetylase RimI-like enzyme